MSSFSTDKKVIFRVSNLYFHSHTRTEIIQIQIGTKKKQIKEQKTKQKTT